jgi:acetyltransferase-like isoleucine patch superfamily enzyme
MRRNHKPYLLEKWQRRLNQWYLERYVRPHFDGLGVEPRILAPRSLQVHGANILAGDYLHIISHPLQPVRLTTWAMPPHQGRIQLGDYCLLAPGVEITAALDIRIGNNCMIATGSSIHDCDWHGLYNRIRPFRCSAPVVLEDNVWIGMHSRIGKGITIGTNSVIGAGSVVTRDIPDNVVAAGNPARVVKHLNPARRFLKREFLFTQSQNYWQQEEAIQEYCQANNTWLGWLRSIIAPNRND